MFKVTERNPVTPNIVMFNVHAPAISHKAKPGQFVIIRAHEKGERIPITLAGTNLEDGEVTIFIASVGASSTEITSIQEGEYLLNFSGPLGNAFKIRDYGKTLCIGGGVFIGATRFLAQELKNAGNYVSSIAIARGKDHLFWEKKLNESSDKYLSIVEDVNEESDIPGIISQLLIEERFDHVFTMGPTSMQWSISEITKPMEIPTTVSLLPVMVDGTGMCGACRLTVDGSTRFACVDGPDFDGHKVDWNELIGRMRFYTPQEKIAMVLHERGARTQ